ncbi:MAG: methyltransferase domain-containing protein [Chloroflexi bacterium]|nr:methyltransferase domain-containing protein [Chloroflexota bacterium]
MTRSDDVRRFWEQHPLFAGESRHPAGSLEFYAEHRRVYLDDCFAGALDIRVLPPPRPGAQTRRILDLGCGVGFWVTEFGMYGLGQLHAADLTEHALGLTRRRLELHHLTATLQREDAERLSYADAIFDHVNCQGVIHHTPDTTAAVAEIARVLRPGGTAVISVYHRNALLRLWPVLWRLAWPLAWLGFGLRGRGREQILQTRDVDELVRRYDGSDNPIGKSYTTAQFRALLEPHLVIDELYVHFFPARAMPFPLPRWLHRMLDRHLGFMVYANCHRPCAE